MSIGLLRARERRSFLMQLWYRQIAWKIRRLYNRVPWLFKGRLGRLLARSWKRGPGAQRTTARALFTIALAFLGCAFAFS